MEFIDRFIFAITELHPVHPMVVHFPIALTGAAFLFILLAHLRNDASFETAAYFSNILAMLGTLVAGFTGYMDNANNYDGLAPNGGTKIMLASLLLLLTAGISIARYRNPNLFQTANRFLYVGSYALSFFIAFVLAFLGGIILYGF